MNRQQFLEQLEAELSGLAPVERQEALEVLCGASG